MSPSTRIAPKDGDRTTAKAVGPARLLAALAPPAHLVEPDRGDRAERGRSPTSPERSAAGGCGRGPSRRAGCRSPGRARRGRPRRSGRRRSPRRPRAGTRAGRAPRGGERRGISSVGRVAVADPPATDPMCRPAAPISLALQDSGFPMVSVMRPPVVPRGARAIRPGRARSGRRAGLVPRRVIAEDRPRVPSQTPAGRRTPAAISARQESHSHDADRPRRLSRLLPRRRRAQGHAPERLHRGRPAGEHRRAHAGGSA